MSLPNSTLGRTGASVSKLGYGALELRSNRLAHDAVDSLLNGVLDAGINMIDTSPNYGATEEHIGRSRSHRSDGYFQASKRGCAVGETAGTDAPARREHVFTPENIRAGGEQSLRRM